VSNCGDWNVTIKSPWAVSSIARLTARSRWIDSYLPAWTCERQRSLLVTAEAYTILALSATLQQTLVSHLDNVSKNSVPTIL
jgi:hypothetical protein